VRVDGDLAGRRQQQRVAVRLRAHGHFRPPHAACPRRVLDDERLAEGGLQLVAEDASDGVDAAAGRERHDQLDGPTGIIGLRDRHVRRREKPEGAGSQDGSEKGRLQHGFLPPRGSIVRDGESEYGIIVLVYAIWFCI
jgi:hypothetical protein